MNNKSHADVGKRFDEKSGFIVNLQGRLRAKTYQKDTDTASSCSKRKQKKKFDFSKPSQALSLVLPREKEFVDTMDAMDSSVRSLAEDQDSLHTARSTSIKFW
jgi:hypothetical protein